MMWMGWTDGSFFFAKLYNSVSGVYGKVILLICYLGFCWVLYAWDCEIYEICGIVRFETSLSSHLPSSWIHQWVSGCQSELGGILWHDDILSVSWPSQPRNIRNMLLYPSLTEHLASHLPLSISFKSSSKTPFRSPRPIEKKVVCGLIWRNRFISTCCVPASMGDENGMRSVDYLQYIFKWTFSALAIASLLFHLISLLSYQQILYCLWISPNQSISQSVKKKIPNENDNTIQSHRCSDCRDVRSTRQRGFFAFSAGDRWGCAVGYQWCGAEWEEFGWYLCAFYVFRFYLPIRSDQPPIYLSIQ